MRPLARRLADRLARLALGLRRHRAGVDDDHIREAGFGCKPLDRLRFIGVETAAEGEDVDAHDASAGSATAKSEGAKTPSCSNSTGPVMST